MSKDVPIDLFDRSQHRAQRKLRLAIQILDNPGENIMGESPLEDEDFVLALGELLSEAADDLAKADRVIQDARKKGHRL